MPLPQDLVLPPGHYSYLFLTLSSVPSVTKLSNLSQLFLYAHIYTLYKLPVLVSGIVFSALSLLRGVAIQIIYVGQTARGGSNPSKLGPFTLQQRAFSSLSYSSLGRCIGSLLLASDRELGLALWSHVLYRYIESNPPSCLVDPFFWCLSVEGVVALQEFL